MQTGKADETAVGFIELCFEIRSRRMPPLHNSSTSACHHLHQQHALKSNYVINAACPDGYDRLVPDFMMLSEFNKAVALWSIRIVFLLTAPRN